LTGKTGSFCAEYFGAKATTSAKKKNKYFVAEIGRRGT